MAGHKTSTRANSRTAAAPRPARSTTPAPLVPPASSPPGEPLLQRKYRDLIRKHLGKLHDRLFAELTGVNFHIAWTPPPPKHWNTQSLPTGCSVCCRLTGSPLLPDCRTCGPKQLARAAARRSPRAGARVLSRVKFSRAARFLRLIVQHVQTASLSDLRKTDLTSAGHAVLALEKEQARLHLTLKRHLPPAVHVRRPSAESHPAQLVRQLREWMERDYGKRITLQTGARKLGMNATYLLALFSRVVGVPFKTHLTGLRMEKAKALLSDPARTLSDVAHPVGYGSEDRFRSAFKKATGLSPKVWRETMQTASA